MPSRTHWQFYFTRVVVIGAMLSPAFLREAHAQVSNDAKILLERIAGVKVPGDDPILKEVSALLAKGDKVAATEKAMSHPGFLNVTVKQMGLKMSTREESTGVAFNDFAASVVGIVRDQMDARLLLRGNFYYVGNVSKLPSGVTVRSDLSADIVRSNNHYVDLDRPTIDLGVVLQRVDGQKIFSVSKNSVVDNPDPAGVLTSRSFMSSHVVAGTNRRAVEYTFREFMCTPIEEWADASSTAERIGRDIDRNPGNNPAKFANSCKACHSQMDSFRGAFAYWHFKNSDLMNSVQESSNLADLGFDAASKVVIKMNHNNQVFPAGYVTKDNSWKNNATGANNLARFGWRGSESFYGSGKGVAGLGAAVSDSRRFSECMVKRVYDAVCRGQSLSLVNKLYFVSEIADKFESNKYNMKKLFSDVVLSKECGQ